MPENQSEFDTLARELMDALELPAAAAHKKIVEVWPECRAYSTWRFPAATTAPPILHMPSPEISTR